jgi:hypothetical protein
MFTIVVGSVVHTLTAIGCLLFFLPVYMGWPSWMNKYVIEVSIGHIFRGIGLGIGRGLAGSTSNLEQYYTCY